MYFAIVVVALYFGWPIVEAVLIMLPIPDPKELKNKFSNIASKKGDTKKPTSGKSGYTGNFKQAPESLGESDDEDDIGRQANIKRNGLSYDSDEERDSSELISLDGGATRDRTNTAAENIPKLQKPQ